VYLEELKKMSSSYSSAESAALSLNLEDDTYEEDCPLNLEDGTDED
jgi:hypothetical protein